MNIGLVTSIAAVGAVGLIGASLGLDQHAASSVKEWKHGFETSRVIATRYKNQNIGENIGFRFPKDPNNSDRGELSDFLEMHGCSVFQGGGYPGAELLAQCDGVTDTATATAKIKEVLPGLSSLMTDISAGREVTIPGLKEKREAEATRAKAERANLVKKATTLISFVKDKQPGIVAEYQADLKRSTALWSFKCQRYGDYLSIVMTRDKAAPQVLSVWIGDRPNIVLRNGHAPDLAGVGRFDIQGVLYDGDKDWSQMLIFPNVELPNDDKRAVAWSSSTAGDENPFANGMPVVQGIARRAQDDLIIIDEGGGSRYEDMLQSSRSFSYSSSEETELKRQRPGATIRVPYGLGNTVYHQIMDAIAIVSTSSAKP